MGSEEKIMKEAMFRKYLVIHFSCSWTYKYKEKDKDYLVRKNRDMTFVEIDCDVAILRPFVEFCGVKVTPTIALFKNNVEKTKIVGRNFRRVRKEVRKLRKPKSCPNSVRKCRSMVDINRVEIQMRPYLSSPCFIRRKEEKLKYSVSINDVY